MARLTIVFYRKNVYTMTNLFDDFLLNRFRDAASPIQITQNFPVAACFKSISLVEIPRIMREKKLFMVRGR